MSDLVEKLRVEAIRVEANAYEEFDAGYSLRKARELVCLLNEAADALETLSAVVATSED